MAIGRSIGNQYLFQDQEGLAPERVPTTVGRSTQASTQAPTAPNFGLPDMRDDVEVVDGMTESYYNSYANLKSMAKSAWSNFGIDVTNPDPSDPFAQKLHRNFMKMYAKTEALGNALSRGREDQEMITKAMIEDPSAVGSTRTGRYGQTVATSDNVGNISVSDTAKDISSSLRSKFDMYGQYDQAKQERDSILAYYDNLISQEDNDIRRMQLKADRDAVAAAIPDFRRLDEDKEDKGSGSGLGSINEIWNKARQEYSSQGTENQAILNTLKGLKGVKDAMYVYGGADQKKPMLRIIPSEKGAPVEIDLQDTDGMRSLGQFLVNYAPNYRKDFDVDEQMKIGKTTEDPAQGDFNPMIEGAVMLMKNIGNTIKKDSKFIPQRLKKKEFDKDAAAIPIRAMMDAINDGQELTLTISDEEGSLTTDRVLEIVDFDKGGNFSSPSMVVRTANSEEPIEIDLSSRQGQDIIEKIMYTNARSLLPYIKEANQSLGNLLEVEDQNDDPLELFTETK